MRGGVRWPGPAPHVGPLELGRVCDGVVAMSGRRTHGQLWTLSLWGLLCSTPAVLRALPGMHAAHTRHRLLSTGLTQAHLSPPLPPVGFCCSGGGAWLAWCGCQPWAHGCWGAPGAGGEGREAAAGMASCPGATCPVCPVLSQEGPRYHLLGTEQGWKHHAGWVLSLEEVRVGPLVRC